MSMSNLSSDGEFRYIVQWFHEWSELQRDDFVPVLVEYLLEPAVYMNGVVNNVSQADINAKPMSLFQCRIKLFRQWCTKWPQDFKPKLKEKIIEMDAKVGEKIINKMQENGILTNGIVVENGAAAAVLSDEDAEELSIVGNAIAAVVQHNNEINNEEGDNVNVEELANTTNGVVDTHTEPEAAPELDTAVATVAIEQSGVQQNAEVPTEA